MNLRFTKSCVLFLPQELTKNLYSNSFILLEIVIPCLCFVLHVLDMKTFNNAEVELLVFPFRGSVMMVSDFLFPISAG